MAYVSEWMMDEIKYIVHETNQVVNMVIEVNGR